MKTTFERIYWIDLETTGLNTAYDAILEVAVVVTDRKFKVLHTAIEERIAWYGDLRDLDPVVVEMHTKNGLFPQPDPHTLYALNEVDLMVRDLIDYDLGPHELAVVGGFCPFFDLVFMRRLMPLSADRISHRVFDVHTLVQAAELKGFTIDKPTTAHRALPDVMAAIEAAKLLMEVL